MIAEAAGPSGMRLTTDQRLDWLQLMRSESIGPKTFRRLLNLYGGAGAALAALPELAARRGKPLHIASRQECARELADIESQGGCLVALGEPDYPAALRATDAAPPLLAVRGSLDILRKPMVAIIGSRNASAAGLAFTERLARDLASAGFIIVSGLARGVDARAHRATLGTGTIAVLAGGLDRIYPPEHEQLAEDLTLRGALVSEMPMGWEARGRDFPRRNRIVSGLALGTVVIEAARNSGSLITARFAAEQGREIFAVPGSPLDPRAEGTNGLLRDGATLCTGASDVIEALAPMIGRSFEPPEAQEGSDPPREPLWDEWDLGDDETPVPTVDLRHDFEEPARTQVLVTAEPTSSRPSPAECGQKIAELLGPAPVSIDDLVRAAGMSVAEVTNALLDLELSGSLERHRGGLLSRAID